MEKIVAPLNIITNYIMKNQIPNLKLLSLKIMDQYWLISQKLIKEML